MWQISDDRVHRWRARRRDLGTLEDLAPGGTAVRTLLATEIDAILEIAETWGPVDGSHRKLAHRGSYIGQVWVSPSTFRRVLAANGLILPQRPSAPRRAKTPWPDWLVWEPNRIWIWDVTHFTRAKRCVFAIVDMVSRYWIDTLVSPEETPPRSESCSTRHSSLKVSTSCSPTTGSVSTPMTLPGRSCSRSPTTGHR